MLKVETVLTDGRNKENKMYIMRFQAGSAAGDNLKSYLNQLFDFKFHTNLTISCIELKQWAFLCA